MIVDRYVWPDMKKNVTFWFRNCKNCNEYTVSVDRLKAANLLTDFLHSVDCGKDNRKSVSSKQENSSPLPDKSKNQTTTCTRTKKKSY